MLEALWTVQSKGKADTFNLRYAEGIHQAAVQPCACRGPGPLLFPSRNHCGYHGPMTRSPRLFLSRLPVLPGAAGLALLAILLLAGPLALAQAVDDQMLATAGADGAQWPSYGLAPGETRYSPLAQINRANVGRLGPAWSFEVGAGGGNQEATPLFWNGKLFGITNWSIAFAIDARTGEELWRWDPELNQEALRPRTCCGIVQRGVALYENLVIAPILDGRLIALDMNSGRPVWETRVAYAQENHTLTMAPRIAGGKVIIGGAGGEFPTRGFFSAFDALTGVHAWIFYTVPGNPSLPFENEAMQMAAQTWSGEWWRTGGGGSVWDSIAYDPEPNLVYVGTGNGGPWPESLRESVGLDNLFVCSILAVNADTGELAWYYQTTPGDAWDYDATQGFILTDLAIDGRERQVLMQANKNGFHYVLDRITGELISAAPFTRVNWAAGIDPVTGRPQLNADAHYDHTGVAATVYPSNGGAHNWSPMAWSRDTGLVYIPASMGGSRTFVVDPNWTYDPTVMNTGVPRAGRADPALVANPRVPPLIGPEGEGGMLLAWDPVAQREVWRSAGGGGSGGGTLATAGRLLFQVLNNGSLRAFDDSSGELLMEIDTGLVSGMGPPITYLLDGVQYLALMGGTGQGGNNPALPHLLSFRLDGSAPLPQRLISVNTGNSAAGQLLYRQTCLPCHGDDGNGGPAGGKSLAEIAQNPQGIIAAITGGQGKDMPAFQGALNEQQVRDLAAYISETLIPQ